ncbi:MAG: hypothetical protein HY790_02260 [Deltaproteobacteria bacterium]|nr:hypothetical protein [Deltaproteobacteria bacterium]
MEKNLSKRIRKNMESMETDQLLKILSENDRDSYSDDAFRIIREVLIERKVDLPPQKEFKDCPNCEMKSEISKEICKCGYNFVKPNLDEISLVKAKRRKKNRFSGLMMILFGIVALLYWLPSYAPDNFNSKDQTIKLILGIPPIMILIGIWKLIFGEAVKAPTGSPFDHILGDKNAKEEEDDIDFILCSSCGKQLFKEMNLKKCPNCNIELK